MITKEIALRLSHRTELYHVSEKDFHGNRIRCRVNGKCKTWARRPEEWRLPVKYGLKVCFYLSQHLGRYWLTREQLDDPQYMALEESANEGVLMDYLKDRGDA